MFHVTLNNDLETAIKENIKKRKEKELKYLFMALFLHITCIQASIGQIGALQDANNT